jgi:hypothetical protein
MSANTTCTYNPAEEDFAVTEGLAYAGCDCYGCSGDFMDSIEPYPTWVDAP